MESRFVDYFLLLLVSQEIFTYFALVFRRLIYRIIATTANTKIIPIDTPIPVPMPTEFLSWPCSLISAWFSSSTMMC